MAFIARLTETASEVLPKIKAQAEELVEEADNIASDLSNSISSSSVEVQVTSTSTVTVATGTTSSTTMSQTTAETGSVSELIAGKNQTKVLDTSSRCIFSPLWLLALFLLLPLLLYLLARFCVVPVFEKVEEVSFVRRILRHHTGRGGER